MDLLKLEKEIDILLKNTTEKELVKYLRNKL